MAFLNLNNKTPLDKPADNRTGRPAVATVNPNVPEKTPLCSRAEYDALHQAGLCKKCCKPVHTKPGERCQEKTWAQMPASIKAAVAKEQKQVNVIEAKTEDALKN